jgi:hypothetical protein
MATLRPKEVFLSHSHLDLEITERLAAELRRHKLKVWYSEKHIAGAQRWLDEIGAALKRCDWFVILLTPAAVKSKWVRREISWALNADHYDGHIVPLLVKECDYDDLAWPIATLQIIKFAKFPTGVRELLRMWKVPYQAKK